MSTIKVECFGWLPIDQIGPDGRALQKPELRARIRLPETEGTALSARDVALSGSSVLAAMAEAIRSNPNTPPGSNWQDQAARREKQSQALGAIVAGEDINLQMADDARRGLLSAGNAARDLLSYRNLVSEGKSTEGMWSTGALDGVPNWDVVPYDTVIEQAFSSDGSEAYRELYLAVATASHTLRYRN